MRILGFRVNVIWDFTFAGIKPTVVVFVILTEGNYKKRYDSREYP
jgi:hypothetical protein